MINLTLEEVLLLHEKLLNVTGGLAGTRDLGLLESALYGALQGFGDEEAYPTPEQRAARLAFSIAQNHPFLDGNKRTAMLVMLMTLRLNQVQIRYSQQELIRLGFSVADGSLGYEGILNWINHHKSRGSDG
ncbi:type II toxin-antitoxin system death-on-curing family toxin [Anaerotruncus colihominis]|uniref:type II toxin-antitoxin system death-on-curing family toxin n=1 Tax=Anaerotruncus colihominis TaxID=169435 RepID=UPI00189C1C26|nr:type II toxin-antitoxin system death-on-curing family toxin [Anaerotruncus colihominis]